MELKSWRWLAALPLIGGCQWSLINPNPVIDAYRDVVPIEDGVQQRAQMSFTSTVYAECANKVKKGWIVELAIAYESKHWEKVQVLLEKMSEYEFSE